MSNEAVNKKHIEYVLLNEEINSLVVHIDLIMFKIKGFDKCIDDLISEELDYTFVVDELKVALHNFEDIAKKLENRLVEFRNMERQLNVPVNLNYIILLKALKTNPAKFRG